MSWSVNLRKTVNYQVISSVHTSTISLSHLYTYQVQTRIILSFRAHSRLFYRSQRSVPRVLPMCRGIRTTKGNKCFFCLPVLFPRQQVENGVTPIYLGPIVYVWCYRAYLYTFPFILLTEYSDHAPSFPSNLDKVQKDSIQFNWTSSSVSLLIKHGQFVMY